MWFLRFIGYTNVSLLGGQNEGTGFVALVLLIIFISAVVIRRILGLKDNKKVDFGLEILYWIFILGPVLHYFLDPLGQNRLFKTVSNDHRQQFRAVFEGLILRLNP